MRRTQARPEADLGAARTTAAVLPPFRASTLSPLPGCRADAHSVAPRANSAPALLAGRSLGAAAMLRATREQAANATTAGAAQLRAVLPWGHSAERSKVSPASSLPDSCCAGQRADSCAAQLT
eukprot:2383355-Pyramimonas_sp.AAC.1